MPEVERETLETDVLIVAQVQPGSVAACGWLNFSNRTTKIPSRAGSSRRKMFTSLKKPRRSVRTAFQAQSSIPGRSAN